LPPDLFSLSLGKYFGQHVVDAIQFSPELLGGRGCVDALNPASGGWPHCPQQGKTDESLGLVQIEFG